MRRYAARDDVTAEGCAWLTRAAVRAGSLWGLDQVFFGQVWHWWLLRGGVEGALVKRKFLSGNVYHYEGDKNAERLVRAELRSGRVKHYEGEKGAERLVRVEFPDGEVQHYEGEKGAERVVRGEFPDGEVQHYEGEKGAEYNI